MLSKMPRPLSKHKLEENTKPAVGNASELETLNTRKTTHNNTFQHFQCKIDSKWTDKTQLLVQFHTILMT